MIFFGICFLFPGLCSLYVIAAITIEQGGNLLSFPYLPPFALVWVICFAISATGIAMIVAARRRPGKSP